MADNISNTLKQLRKTSGKSANTVVSELAKFNIRISAKTLYGYESGLSMPNADVFVALCKIYNCDNPMNILGNASLSSKESSIIRKYRVLDEHGTDMVDTVLDKEYDRCCAEDGFVPLLNAAHERTDIDASDDMKRYDEEIMDDPDF